MGMAIFGKGYLDGHRELYAHANQAFDLFLKRLTVMLQIPLALIVCGLSQQMWYINSSVAYILVVVGAGLYIWSIVAVLSM